MRLMCPTAERTKEERIQLLFRNIENWIKSPAMMELVQLFGGENLEMFDLAECINYLNDFVEIWNYRAKDKALNNDTERWNVFDNQFVIKNADTILHCAEMLGLVKETYPISFANYILPLGGARFSNLERPKYAREAYDIIMQMKKNREVNIIALSGTRPISDKEREAVNTYALSAKTEYDAINIGLEKAFDLCSGYDEEVKQNQNINLCACIRRYYSKLPNTRIASMAAPSTDPKRRANSRDTFEYFLKYYDIQKNDTLLLVTSQIYVPYQLLKIADLAIEKEFNVECIGYGMEKKNMLAKPSNYLQEIKGTVNAISYLLGKYEK